VLVIVLPIVAAFVFAYWW